MPNSRSGREKRFIILRLSAESSSWACLRLKGAMNKHAEYGKQVIRKASKQAFTDWGPSVEIDYGTRQPARIDGTIGNLIAVEIESRVAKQVRGAVLDLLCHGYQKKLLVLIPVHMDNPEATRLQCQNILERFLRPSDFRVVLLRGTGDFPSLESDAELVRNAIIDLGFHVEI